MKINFRLSSSDVNKAINELTAYQRGLDSKCQAAIYELCNLGMLIAQKDFKGQDVYLKTYMMSKNKIMVAVVAAGNAVLFIEFGAGIRYNQGGKHPLADKFGYGVGTYPNQKHAFDENGWWYLGEDGKFHHSYGVKSMRPMYFASTSMRSRAVKMFKENFNVKR